MNEYLISAEGCKDFGLTFEAEDDGAAIEKFKDTIPELIEWSKVWNLYIVERNGFPELHTVVDATGPYHQAFIKQGILEDDAEITIETSED
jgi:hypothetical protein